MEPAEPPAPLPVSGAICGLVSLHGQRNLALGLTLDLSDDSGNRVATVKLDSAAKFQFDRLSIGRVHITRGLRQVSGNMAAAAKHTGAFSWASTSLASRTEEPAKTSAAALRSRV